MNVLEVSPLKTLIFNLHYFKLRGLKFPVLVFNNFKLKKCSGVVELSDWSFGAVRLGQQIVGIIDCKTEKGIWCMEGRKVTFEGKAKIGSACRIISNSNGNIIFGDGVNITGRTSVISDNKISIGAKSLISWDCLLMDTDFHKVVDENESVNERKNIVLDEHVWIGCRATILGGTQIPENSVVAAGSVLTKAFSEKGLLLGANNKVLKTDIFWKM